jgi:hypothetical protein
VLHPRRVIYVAMQPSRRSDLPLSFFLDNTFGCDKLRPCSPRYTASGSLRNTARERSWTTRAMAGWCSSPAGLDSSPHRPTPSFLSTECVRRSNGTTIKPQRNGSLETCSWASFGAISPLALLRLKDAMTRPGRTSLYVTPRRSRRISLPIQVVLLEHLLGQKRLKPAVLVL